MLKLPQSLISCGRSFFIREKPAIGLQSAQAFLDASQGKTKEDAIQNIREAIEGYSLALQQDGLPVPT